MEKLKDVFFYNLDKAIKIYRQFAQDQLKKEGLIITIDQWLVLKVIHDYGQISQQEIAEKVFKDGASVTRIITLLVSKNLIVRKANGVDRRMRILTLPNPAKSLLIRIDKLSQQNRIMALKGLTKNEIDTAHKVMTSIIGNCK